MRDSIENKLVVAIASSALFDLTEADRVFREQGVEEYRRYQGAHEQGVLRPGVVFPFIRRMLNLTLSVDGEHLVEVVLLSRSDPDTGLRVLKSIEHHKLGMTRAAFVGGGDPHRYMEAFNASLFLSANQDDVKSAVMKGLPVGQVFKTDFIDDESEHELRIAFDFDGVIADDSAEEVYQKGGLDVFQATEKGRAQEALSAGPLKQFLQQIAELQQREIERQNRDMTYRPKIRTAIITARNAPARERVVITLREWGMRVDEAFFLRGMDKGRILKEFRPHIFFDDQLVHIEKVAGAVPSVHVPFGVTNRLKSGDKDEQMVKHS